MLLAPSLLCTVLLAASPGDPREDHPKDTISTSAGSLEITFIGHGTVMMKFAGLTIHVDPFSRLTDYKTLPKADIVLITHHHGDHLDVKALEQARTASTVVIITERCASRVSGGIVMRNGDVRTVRTLRIEAVPAYNIMHKSADGLPFHPRGEGNGYVLTFGATRVYFAGDTENIPEMKALKRIDVAFLPMNLPYTMTAEMVADAAIGFRPKVLYPYHTGETDTGLLAGLLQDHPEIEIRIRPMK